MLILFSIKAHAVSIEEIQEVRYARAELAFIDGREDEGVRILAQNLNSKFIHIPSFKLLAKYHFERKQYAKGFKIYYYLIKKFHGPHILRARMDNNFEYFLRSIPQPNAKASELYFDIASLYLDVIEQNGMPEAINQLYLLTYKYLRVCEFYKIKPADTKLSLARLMSHKEHFEEAIDNVLDAQELFEQDQQVDQEKLRELDFLLGENLLKAGFSDAGSLYLKSVYLDSKSSPVLREFASSYLQALQGTLISASLFYNYRYSSNPHELTDDEMTNFSGSSNETFYGQKNGAIHSRGFNFFILKSIESETNFLFGGTYIDDQAQEENLNLKDGRTISLSAEAKTMGSDKGQWKLRYNVNFFYLRPSMNEPIQQSSTLHIFTTQYSYSLKSGLISYSLPIEYTNSQSSENTKTISFQLDYSPFRFSKYFMPSYSLKFTPKKEETGELQDSSVTSFSISNFTALRDRHALFTDVSYDLQSNNDPSESYSEFSLGASYSYQLSFLPELALNLSVSMFKRSLKDNQQVSNQTTSMGMTYTF